MSNDVDIPDATTKAARPATAVPAGPREFGRDRGLFTVPDAFDEPLPELVAAFDREGPSSPPITEALYQYSALRRP